ncbi:glycosyltransferase [Amnibacterium flavum]|uniref:Spore protein YkvP/CgeB glycosyl transferase-like domain-containing protein n=1 Tax=Amnibacterium flavum TaxID=2173173 RepID=A0A2V1HTF0_9MICO|nr:glycosyltransferase [Amnibacterium flavum]PVZ95865.1 hypothetical protein DDQ50_05215 [Amnibacterium flavum]
MLFVGTARGLARPSVVAPIRAGFDVSVYGPDWRPFIPARYIRGVSLPYGDLPGRYEEADLVLNDHWPAMQRNGFIANRPFDVVAAGGRVVTDNVEGIEEIFGGAVRTFADDADLVSMLSADHDSLFPGAAELAAIGERVRRAHSFDSRAVSLLEAALGEA